MRSRVLVSVVGVPLILLVIFWAPIQVMVVALGLLSAMGGIVGIEPLEKLVRRKFAAKPKVAERNIKALNAGRSCAPGAN